MPILPLQDGYVDLDSLKAARAGRFSALTRTEGRLLRYLWSRRGQLVGRDELLEAVWGYRKGVKSRTLDTYIWRLRRKLEVDPAAPALLLTEARQGVRLVPPPPPPVEGPGEAAVVTVLAPALPLRALEDGALLGEWRALRSATLEQAADRGLRPLGTDPPGRITLSGIAAEPALDLLRALLQAPSVVGALQAGLEVTRWSDGQRSAALEVAAARAARLATVALPQQVLASLASSRALPPRRTVAVGQLSLQPGAPAEPLFQPRPGAQQPPPTTPPLDGVVFGRAAALATLNDAAAGARLVTVAGPAGIGKSTLVRAWVERALDVSALDDVVYCELGPDATAAAIAPALGRALGVPQDNIADALAARGPVLVLLDRVGEALPAGREQLAAWMAAAPESRWLLTARAPIGAPEEAVVPLQPLPPSAAAAMFLDRVAGLPGYAALAPSDDVVAELIAAIGGAPLAIELASNRARLFRPLQLLARLQADPDLLRGADAPRRPAALDGAVAFSWGLLSARARAALSRLATFPGDFSMDAAEAVLAGADGAPAGLVEELADAALVRLRHEPLLDDVRLVLPEPVRVFALQRLAPADAATARRQAAAWLAEVSRVWRAEATAGPRQYDALRCLRAEQHNLLAAVDALCADAPAAALDILRACMPLVAVLQTLSPALVFDRLERLPEMTGAAGRAAAWLRCSLGSRLRSHEAVLEEAEVLLADPALEDELRDQAAVLRVVSLFLAGRVDEAAVGLDALRPLFAASPLPPWRFSLCVSVAVFYSQLPGGLAVARELARTGLAEAEAYASPLTSDRLRLYRAKCDASVGDLSADELPELLERCRRMAAEGARAIAQPYLLNVARAQLALCGPDAAEPIVREVRRQARRAGDSFELGNIDRLLVEVHLAAGRLDEARALARALVAQARGATANTFLRRALIRLALVELHAGHPDAGLVATADLKAQAVTAFDTFHLYCIETALHAARGDADAARASLAAAQPPSPAIALLRQAATAWIEPAQRAPVKTAAARAPLSRATGNSGFVLRALLAALP